MGEDEVFNPRGLYLLVKTDASCQGVRSRSAVYPSACSFRAQPSCDPSDPGLQEGHLAAPRAPWSIPCPQHMTTGKPELKEQTDTQRTHILIHLQTHTCTFIYTYGHTHQRAHKWQACTCTPPHNMRGMGQRRYPQAGSPGF